MAFRRFPIGAEVVPEGVHFRVWAPRRRKVEVVLEPGSKPGAGTFAAELFPEDRGYFSGAVSDAGDGSLYRFRLDGEAMLYPDPASRFQPEGPNGPSQVVDPSLFSWTDDNWRGVSLKGQIIYEMHIGTFTPGGTWVAASSELPELADAGITLLEIMPIAEFPGRFGWGYDGVDLFAPTRLYGTPDDCRRFIDRAHALGLGVILDVVYNHLGPDGNYLKQYAADYFTERYPCEWGEAINFDGANSEPVREFFISNARYWIEEFHFDGLRLDATHAIFDSSRQHILAQVTAGARRAAKKRSIVLVAEDEFQRAWKVLPPEKGGLGMDGLWNDDFHHSATVALSGRNEAYYSDYLGKAQEFISGIKWGYLYQGQHYKWQKQRRGTTSLGLNPEHFILYIQNHDQVANSGRGLRCQYLTSPGQFRAMTALLLLAPGTPMLFQGQEFASSSPFLYFADHEEELSGLVAKGRREFLSQFPSLAVLGPSDFDLPADPVTFRKSKLDLSERVSHEPIYRMHRDLIRLRKSDPLFSLQRRGGVDGAVLGESAFVLRFFSGDMQQDRLLIVNFGPDLHLDPAPEPLLAPPFETQWGILWSSEAPEYGGAGTAPLDTEETWRIPGRAAVALYPRRENQKNGGM